MRKVFICLLSLIAPSPSFADKGIGYPSIDAAMAALQKNKSVEFRRESGWTIAEDKDTNTVWSFAPFGHPAYPAAVKRSPVKKDGAVYLSTTALCGASKQACDKMMEEFAALDEKVKEL